MTYGFLTQEESVAEGGVIEGVRNIHLQLHCPLGQAHEEPQLQEHPGPRRGDCQLDSSASLSRTR